MTEANLIDTLTLLDAWLDTGPLGDSYLWKAPHACEVVGATLVFHESRDCGSGLCLHGTHKDQYLGGCPEDSAKWAAVRPAFQRWAQDRGWVVERSMADRAALYMQDVPAWTEKR